MNPSIRTQVRAGKYWLGFYSNDCPSHYVRKKGTWERVAFIYDRAAQTQTVVVDGVLMDRCTGREPFFGTDTVYMGTWGGGRLWKGKIKNVKFFNKALSPEKADMILQRNQLEWLPSCSAFCRDRTLDTCKRPHIPPLPVKLGRCISVSLPC